MLLMGLVEFMAAAQVEHKKTKNVKSDDKSGKTNKKKDIFLSFDEDLLVEAKRVLFQNKTTVQQFVTFLLFKLANRHEDIEKILCQLNEHLLNEAITKEEEEAILKINSENLYSYFEDLDKKNLEG